jgi:DNA modification methylase
MIGPWAVNAVHQTECLAGLKQTPDDVFDVIVTSPPYWGQRGGEGLGTEPDPRDYVRNLVAILAESMRCLKPTGTLWLNIGDSYNTPINWTSQHSGYSTLGKDKKGHAADNMIYRKDRGRRRAFIDPETGWLKYGNLLAIPYRIVTGLTDRGFLFRGEVIWTKSRPVPEGLCRRPHRRHEGIYIFAREERHRFRVKPPVGSVWKLVQQPNLTEHSSAFPIDLPRQCIDAAGLAEPGLVFDPFMGSGTTAEAAKLLGHDYVGFELDPTHCDIANRRLTATADQQRLPLADGVAADDVRNAPAERLPSTHRADRTCENVSLKP